MSEKQKKKPDLSNYVEVHERIEAFYEKFPEGSLQSKFQISELAGQTVIIVEASAYRTPDDERPGIGLASEPVPGKTPYTEDSELMNAETSAWGRALAALGFKVNRGISSASEIRNRSGGSAAEATGPQKGAITRRCNELALTDDDKKILFEWAGGPPLTKGKAGKILDVIKEAKDWGDVWDRAGLPHPEIAPADDLPIDEQALREEAERAAAAAEQQTL